MGRGKEGEREERRHVQRPGRYGGAPVGPPDIFVQRFSYDLEALAARLILDAGCGIGRNTAFLAELGYRMVALDSAAGKVREARTKTQKEDISFVTGRLECLPFSPDSFDALCCTYTLEYLEAPDISRVLTEFRRVLKKGGLLLLATAAKEGSGFETGRDLGQNSYSFDQGETEVRVHLTDRAELQRWLEGFIVREILRLSLEYPKPATISANWGVIAELKG